MQKKVLVLIFFAVHSFSTMAQPGKNAWVDSVFQTLNVDEKIGQLLMPKVGAITDDETEKLLTQIKQNHIGGILITQATPLRHIQLVNKLQEKSKVPLLVGITPAERFRLADSLIAFPSPLELSAIKDDSLIQEFGGEIARQMKLLGAQIYFGPNADIDYELDNYPDRLNYFGSSKERVARKAWAFAGGLQRQGVLAVAVHSSDKKPVEIPVEAKDGILRLGIPDTTQFYPYQFLMQNGIGGILTSNIHYTANLGKEVVPANITQLFISDLIKKKLGYQGLVFTEVPLLQHKVEKPRGGETETLAIQIGNDVLLDPQNIAATVKNLKKILKKDKAFQQQLDDVVKRILGSKYDAGLFAWTSLNSDNLVARLNNTGTRLLQQKLIDHSVAVIANKKTILPVAHLEDKKFALISVGAERENAFQHMLGKYAAIDSYEIRSVVDTVGLTALLKKYETVVVALHPLSTPLISTMLPYLFPYRSTDKIILFNFSDPKQLLFFQDFPTIVQSASDEVLPQETAAQILFGGKSSLGELPINVSNQLKEGKGEDVKPNGRFVYTAPEEAAMDSKTLSQIERIVREAIDSGATPGAHVFVARKGKVVYDRSFGWQTYQNRIAVNDQTIYDLASVTKVSATLQAVMFLYEKGMIDLDKKASVYLPELKKSNKKDFTLRDILTHQAGLWPFLPFWAQTMKDSVHMPEYYSFGYSESYPFPVSKDLFASAAMKDSLWSWIVHAKVRPKVDRTPFDYRYSDMGFYILQHLAEKLLNQPLEDFLEQNLYEPLGAYTTGYLPLSRFAPERIAPTENDTLFRKSLLVGYVHDQGAAMHGGVAGHAGLFSTANDLAKLGQLWLNKGTYGGVQYFKPETIETFTGKQFDTSRRGLGWDKPTISDWAGPTTLFASQKTFGHTGFTGTCIWVDPDFDLVFVFLSNRVHPEMTNNKLLNANIRPRIQEVIYRSIFNYCQYGN